VQPHSWDPSLFAASLPTRHRCSRAIPRKEGGTDARTQRAAQGGGSRISREQAAAIGRRPHPSSSTSAVVGDLHGVGDRQARSRARSMDEHARSRRSLICHESAPRDPQPRQPTQSSTPRGSPARRRGQLRPSSRRAPPSLSRWSCSCSPPLPPARTGAGARAHPRSRGSFSVAGARRRDGGGPRKGGAAARGFEAESLR
jgi:hypothetical protein